MRAAVLKMTKKKLEDVSQLWRMLAELKQMLAASSDTYYTAVADNSQPEKTLLTSANLS